MAEFLETEISSLYAIDMLIATPIEIRDVLFMISLKFAILPKHMIFNDITEELKSRL